MKHCIIYCILLLTLMSFLLGKDDVAPNDKYLFSSSCAGYQYVKDIGTSPLAYKGVRTRIALGYVEQQSRGFFAVKTKLDLATTFAGTYYNLNYIVGGMQLRYLHSMPFIIHKDVNLLLGGSFDASASAAVNPDLQNATLNVDYLFDLMLSSQIEHDFFLKEQNGKFLFINYHFPKRTYRAFFRIDLPLLLLNGRPEFAYLNPEDMDYFSRHYYLGGYSMRTEVGVKRYLNNGNILEIKYDWDMFTSGNKDIYLLERASHNLAFSFYFRLN